MKKFTFIIPIFWILDLYDAQEFSVSSVNLHLNKRVEIPENKDHQTNSILKHPSNESKNADFNTMKQFIRKRIIRQVQKDEGTKTNPFYEIVSKKITLLMQDISVTEKKVAAKFDILKNFISHLYDILVIIFGNGLEPNIITSSSSSLKNFSNDPTQNVNNETSIPNENIRSKRAIDVTPNTKNEIFNLFKKILPNFIYNILYTIFYNNSLKKFIEFVKELIKRILKDQNKTIKPLKQQIKRP
ncbi:hypothetical protein PGB90_006042 [Kerria lacca]